MRSKDSEVAGKLDDLDKNDSRKKWKIFKRLIGGKGQASMSIMWSKSQKKFVNSPKECAIAMFEHYQEAVLMNPKIENLQKTYFQPMTH